MKQSLIIIFLVFCQIILPAQIFSGYGVKAGIGFSNHSWDYSTGSKLNFDYKTGFSPRLYADFLDLRLFKTQVEIGYIRKGFTFKVPVTSAANPDGTGEFLANNGNLDYLLISALAKLKFDVKLFTPYIIAGPQLNLLLNKSADDGWKVVYEKLNKSNIDISLGAGTEIKLLLPVSFLVEYRYERDLKDNHDSPDIDIKNYSHVILIGIKF